MYSSTASNRAETEPSSTPMNSDLDKLVANLQVERIDKYLFIGTSPQFPPRVFGGQVLFPSMIFADGDSLFVSSQVVFSSDTSFAYPG